MEHIAQVVIHNEQWIQYQPWFWIRNYTPKDFVYNPDAGLLTLFNEKVITEFHQAHPNLPFETVHLSKQF